MHVLVFTYFIPCFIPTHCKNASILVEYMIDIFTKHNQCLCHGEIWIRMGLPHLLHRRGGVVVERTSCMRAIEVRSPVGIDLSR